MCRIFMCLVSFVLVLAMPAWAWEFNGDDNTEGWTRPRSTPEPRPLCSMPRRPMVWIPTIPT